MGSPQPLLKGRYRILGLIGEGGFGAVYKAEDTQFVNRIVAIKEMSQSGLSSQEVEAKTEIFRREAMLLAGLTHPALPRIYDHFTTMGRWYLVMDFIEGETLEVRLQRSPCLPLEEVLDNMQSRPIRGTVDWRKYEVVLDVPQQTVGIYFGVLLAGSGQVWLSNVQLEAVSEGVQTTA